ncbi:MAG: AAA family ATPase [Desulfobacteraceae bacterium]|nr:AAA family ATPase [Desulfobacteraceae bacterium]
MDIDNIDIGMQNDYIACAYLFSPHHAKNKGFLENLNLSKVKKAFREKAKQYHPDLHGYDCDEMIVKRQERFVKIKKSYEYLHFKLKKENPVIKERTVSKEIKKPKIIAVGGAKGGIGKSIFASNLSVYLSNKGFDTIAADFDLGGSNLHLFLGKTHIKKSINDYLSNEVGNIKDILVKTKYGPGLIGGNSSQLGASNISFTRKLKLLKAIRNIKADYIVMDLGGDTSYNVLDFFLAADLCIVMTTCDPASYLDAYSFIKVALYRKLNRLFGSESGFTGEADHVLKNIIHEATMSRNNPLVKDIDELIQRVKNEHPSSISLINKALSDFTPQIIVNKITDEKAALQPVNRIQEVSRKKLSINVGHLCSLPFQREIEESARTLIPWVYKAPNGTLAKKIDHIVTKFLDTMP